MPNRQLKNKLDCFAFARNDAIVEFEDNESKKMLKIKTVMNLSTYRLIDLKNVKNLFPYFPIPLSLNNRDNQEPAEDKSSAGQTLLFNFFKSQSVIFYINFNFVTFQEGLSQNQF